MFNVGEMQGPKSLVLFAFLSGVPPWISSLLLTLNAIYGPDHICPSSFQNHITDSILNTSTRTLNTHLNLDVSTTELNNSA